ncbi:MAG TPA: methyltransferase domain-containing protein [Gemmatimonadaceae bacterium]|nr:methyltransferase domain-containing protein [Gemmatimonadaceae bacterium]
MTALLTPRRRRGLEYLDEPGVDGRVTVRSLQDVACANRYFGGVSAPLAELRIALRELRTLADGESAVLLDVGTGLGDIAARARAVAADAGIPLRTVGVDASEPLARNASCPALPTARADALALPFADDSVDIVLCSQLLHHFENDRAIELLRELDRVAKHRVIVSDLRRSWFAASGIWLVSFPLRFHPVSRHDGVVSVLRGFTRGELERMVERAVHTQARVRQRPTFRLTAAWTPNRIV